MMNPGFACGYDRQVKDVTVRYKEAISRMHSDESGTSTLNFVTEVCSLQDVQICRSISVDDKEDIINCAI